MGRSCFILELGKYRDFMEYYANSIFHIDLVTRFCGFVSLIFVA